MHKFANLINIPLNSMRYYIRLSYDGAGFCGWQIQPNGVTIQESLQKALSLASGEDITVTGAGRTDTGVNAVNYTAHFDITGRMALKPEDLAYKINAIMGKGIIVHEIAPAKDDFHARFSAVSREYKYFLHRKKDPFMGNFSWHCKYSLDTDAMNMAASALLGTHDFRCFEKKGGNNMTSICTIYDARWDSYLPDHVKMLGYPGAKEDYLVFTVRADRFLRNMVRAIVGTLVDIGRGRHGQAWMKELMENGSRSDAGESVPGHALFLTEIKY